MRPREASSKRRYLSYKDACPRSDTQVWQAMDYWYYEDSGRPETRTFVKSFPANYREMELALQLAAMRNADSYAFFVMELGERRYV